MPKLRDRTTTNFQTYLDSEVLVGLTDREKSTTFTELQNEIENEYETVRLQTVALLKHKQKIQDLATTLHTDNEDLSITTSKRLRADAFSYTADPNTTLYEGGLNATWTPDNTDVFKGVFTFQGASGFNNAEIKSWFPLKYQPPAGETDFSEYKGFEFTSKVLSVAGQSSQYGGVFVFQNKVKCEHKLDDDSNKSHFRNPGNMYFRKKAADVPPANSAINFAGSDEDLIFAIRPAYRLYAKMVNKMEDGTNRVVSDIHLLDNPKACTHLTLAQIQAIDPDAKKWAPTETRWRFVWDNVSDPKDNANRYYVGKNQEILTGSSAPRRYQNKNCYVQVADPLNNGVTNAQGAVGYNKLCPRDNVQTLEIDPFMKLNTWIASDEEIQIEISNVKLFKT